MRARLVLCVVIYIYSSNLLAQNINLSFRVEPWMALIETTWKYNDRSSKLAFSEIPSFYFLVSKNITDKFLVGLKPGILFYNDGFFELGFLVRRTNILKYNVYLSGGINMQFRKEVAHGAGFVEVEDSKILYFLVFGIGYKISKNVAIDMTYYHTLNPTYGYFSVVPDYPGAYNASGQSKLHYMIKLGLELSTSPQRK